MAATIDITCGCGETGADTRTDSKKVQRCKFCKDQVWPPTAALVVAAKVLIEGGAK